MTEYEKLKWIFYKIDFKFPNSMNDEIGGPCKWDKSCNGEHTYRYLSVREIIFIPEFMDKYWEYYKLNKFSSESIYKTMQLELFNNLHDPVTYLYDLLFNK